jgi:hypothetical protein
LKLLESRRRNFLRSWSQRLVKQLT